MIHIEFYFNILFYEFFREFPFNAVNIDDLAIQKFKGHKVNFKYQISSQFI